MDFALASVAAAVQLGANNTIAKVGLVLGGVAFPDSRGLAGHSDADVVAHACADALLGAAGLGDIVVDVFNVSSPVAAENFVNLSEAGYYDGIVFHRVIPGFVIQGGDPDGNGRGGPGYKFEDELPRPGQYEIGSLAMANAGPNTNGSQFFIITGHHGASLPPNYSLFGKVVSGIDVVQALNAVGSPGAGTPKEKVGMISVTISEE